jgi:hypothetical protein
MRMQLLKIALVGAAGYLKIWCVSGVEKSTDRKVTNTYPVSIESPCMG